MFCDTMHPNYMLHVISTVQVLPMSHFHAQLCMILCAVAHPPPLHIHPTPSSTHTHTPFGSLPCGLIVSRLKGLKPLGFNHDEMMFAPVSQGKAAQLHTVNYSADLANLDGWLIGGWSEAVYNKGLFSFLSSRSAGGCLITVPRS